MTGTSSTFPIEYSRLQLQAGARRPPTTIAPIRIGSNFLSYTSSLPITCSTVVLLSYLFSLGIPHLFCDFLVSIYSCFYFPAAALSGYLSRGLISFVSQRTLTRRIISGRRKEGKIKASGIFGWMNVGGRAWGEQGRTRRHRARWLAGCCVHCSVISNVSSSNFIFKGVLPLVPATSCPSISSVKASSEQDPKRWLPRQSFRPVFCLTHAKKRNGRERKQPRARAL